MLFKSFTTALFLLATPHAISGNIGPDGFHQFLKRIFVETGTGCGDGIQHALEAGFKAIYSIDNDQNCVDISRKRFIRNPRVHILLKDSGNGLFDLIQNIDEPVTFWLDASNGTPNPDRSVKNTPLMDELDQIKRHSIKTHTILIDDLHCCETPYFDYLRLDQIISKVLEINPEYYFAFVDGGDDGEYEGNILVAYIE